MTALRSLTVLAMRSGASADSGPPEEARELIRARGGEFHADRNKVALWSFLSPTEAVLAGLDSCAHAPGAGVAVGVAIGEVEGEGDKIQGEPVDDALALAAEARPQWVLFSKAASLSLNNIEVTGEEAGWLEVAGRRGKIEAFRAFRGTAERSQEMRAASSAKMAAATKQQTEAPPSTTIALWPALVALLVGLIAGSWGIESHDPAGLARAAADRGRPLCALEHALEAWSKEPGNEDTAKLLTDLGIQEAGRFSKAGRYDRAVHLLRRVRTALPYDDAVEDELFDVGSGLIRQWVLARRVDLAQLEEDSLAADLPSHAARLRKVRFEAQLDELEVRMSPVIAAKDHIRYETVKKWSEVVDGAWKEFPEWGRIRYLWGRLAFANRRYEDMGRHYIEAISRDQSYADSRQILTDVRRACEKTAGTYERGISQLRRVLSDSLGDWVTKELEPWLEERNSVVRTSGYRVLKARHALPTTGLLDYHLMNLALATSASEKKPGVTDLELEEALDWLSSLSVLEDVTRARRALESLPGAVTKSNKIHERSREVLQSLLSRQ